MRRCGICFPKVLNEVGGSLLGENNASLEFFSQLRISSSDPDIGFPQTFGIFCFGPF